MSPGPGRAVSRSDTLLLSVCLLLSLGALLLPAPWALNLATGIRATALVPLVWLQQNAEEQRTSRARFRTVVAARDSVALSAQALPELRAENQQLRALLGLRSRVQRRTVPAEVLRQPSPTDGRTVTLGVGTAEGVVPGSPVVSPEGLVGLVLSASQHSSVAMTWAHPDFRASAVTEDGSVLGIVAPAPGSDASQAFLELRGVPYRDTVAVGTLVVTSGLTGVYPRGIPVGRIAGIRREELGWERIYRVRPAANPGYVSHVLVYPGGQDGAPVPKVP